MNRSRIAVLALIVTGLAMPATAVAGHNLGMTLDHAGEAIQLEAPPSNAFTSGGPGAKWELLKTFPTGNPHTDVDFFTQGGNTFVSAGTLGIGPNDGGQEIFQLTEGGRVAPKPVSSHGSASCLSNAADATGLQHDVEATPKGNAILNADVTAPRARTPSCCWMPPTLPGAATTRARSASSGVPQGGLEIIDVTDIKKPGRDRLHKPHRRGAHGERGSAPAAHRLRIDLGQRRRERRRRAQQRDGHSLNLDGFEMVDLSSCMNFPAGTTVAGQARPLPARRCTATATRRSSRRWATPTRTASTAATSWRSTRTTG